jgi:hypothetical protein
MTIAIIYCETLQSEISTLANKVPEISHLEVMPWKLHIDPDLLLAEVTDQIERLQDQVDVIVLGYGRCQTFDRLSNNFKVPILRPEAEDCIGILLGQERYEKELQQCPGTWFLSPGWTRMGTDFVFHELQLNRVGRKDIDLRQFARRMLEGFTRALYIDMHCSGEKENLRQKARQIANDLDLELEETQGSYSMLEDVMKQALAIVKEQLFKTRTMPSKKVNIYPEMRIFVQDQVGSDSRAKEESKSTEYS